MPFWLKTRVNRFCPPSPPFGVCVMASLVGLSAKFRDILTRVGVPSQFVEWLKAKKLWQPIDFYLLTVDETRIDDEIIEAYKMDAPSIVEPSVEVSIRQVWLCCRDSVRDLMSMGGKEFDLKELAVLNARWNLRYATKLRRCERVESALMKRLYVMAHSQPPTFEIVLLEEITFCVAPASLVQQDKFIEDHA